MVLSSDGLVNRTVAAREVMQMTLQNSPDANRGRWYATVGSAVQSRLCEAYVKERKSLYLHPPRRNSRASLLLTQKSPLTQNIKKKSVSNEPADGEADKGGEGSVRGMHQDLLQVHAGKCLCRIKPLARRTTETVAASSFPDQGSGIVRALEESIDRKGE